jgi:limonene-1,2-epoxide hydrolase
MSALHEAAVRSLMEAWTTGDNATTLGCLVDGASYRVNAWHEPLTSLEAIANDLERQHALWSDLRVKLLNIASIGNVVFTERIDTVHMAGGDVDVHIVGVFEVGDDGKISSWRDYYDMKEVEAQLAP